MTAPTNRCCLTTTQWLSIMLIGYAAVGLGLWMTLIASVSWESAASISSQSGLEKMLNHSSGAGHSFLGSAVLCSGGSSSVHFAELEDFSLAFEEFSESAATDDRGGDKFEKLDRNRVKLTSEEPVSTFSVDVDTASYAYARRQLKNWNLPPPEAINIEEFINYFDYDFPQPRSESVPFEPSVIVSDSPWNKGRKLMHIGIKGYDVDPSARPLSNIVFLVDVSGSMDSPDKLPLAREAIKMLLDTMQPEDFVSVVTYASNVNIPLPPTPVAHKDKILSVLDSLQAGGATWGTGGIEKAYELAEKNYDKDAVNRIMLVTDGDFNIGLVDSGSLQTYIEGKRETGIFLSVLGFGMGNYKDTTMKALANHGNGVAAYIDSLEEAQKVMVTEASSTVFPIAKDVKVQIEFNPATVLEYRLVGYEKRILRREDFNNDHVDAGDIGSGHTVTAIYELTPVGSEEARALDSLRYGGKGTDTTMMEMAEEYAFVKLRYKLPNETESNLLSRPVTKEDHAEVIMEQGDIEKRIVVDEFGFATAVASFAQVLKGQLNATTYARVIEMAEASLGKDPHGYRKEFVSLVRIAKTIALPTGQPVDERDSNDHKWSMP